MAVGLLGCCTRPGTRAGGCSWAGCGCAREDPGTLIGPGSISPDRWVYGGAEGGPPPPGANTTPWQTQWFLFIGASSRMLRSRSMAAQTPAMPPSLNAELARKAHRRPAATTLAMK
jgi:hypothetical protein